MAGPRRLDRQPAEVRELIGHLRLGGATIAEVRAALAERGVAISYSALAKWCRRFAGEQQSMQRQRLAAEVLTERVGAASGPSTVVIAACNIELVQTAILDLLARAAGADTVTLSVRELRQLAEALAKLSQAARP